MCGNPVYKRACGKTMAMCEQEYSLITWLTYMKIILPEFKQIVHHFEAPITQNLISCCVSTVL